MRSTAEDKRRRPEDWRTIVLDKFRGQSIYRPEFQRKKKKECRSINYKAENHGS
jgi:hypothetical protein